MCSGPCRGMNATSTPSSLPTRTGADGGPYGVATGTSSNLIEEAVEARAAEDPDHEPGVQIFDRALARSASSELCCGCSSPGVAGCGSAPARARLAHVQHLHLRERVLDLADGLLRA